MRSFKRLLGLRKRPAPAAEMPMLSFSDTRLVLGYAPTTVEFANSARLLDESSHASSSTTVLDEEIAKPFVEFHDKIVSVPNPHLDGILSKIGCFVCIGYLADYTHIYIAKHTDKDEYVAIKQQEIRSPRTRDVEYKSLHEMAISWLLSDAQLAKLAGHKYIVKFVGHVPCFDTNLHLLVSEYCVAGNLFAFLNGPGQRISTRQRFGLARDFTNGLHYIHSLNVAHRDFKHENLFLDYDPDEGRYIVKIGDFGSSIVAASDSSFVIKPGSPFYAAPELLMHGPYSPMPADVWAYGVALYVLFEMDYPFEIGMHDKVVHDAVELIFDRIDEVIFSDAIIQKLLGSLIAIIFRFDPASRPDMNMIMLNRYFSKHAASISREDFAGFVRAQKK